MSLQQKRYSKVFCINDKYYYADIVKTYDCGNECMIFKCTKNGVVRKWDDLYCKRGLDVTEKNLLACIDEFSKNAEG